LMGTVRERAEDEAINVFARNLHDLLMAAPAGLRATMGLDPGLPCTVTPCFGARLVQEGNRLHYLADRAGIRGLFSDADAYHLD
ncbi:type IV toxin-antitoxin system YeeU family antitoxin, partial [Escherichia coli]|uniref:type IV toxin-antitoxin system YeeU family antitoxin n=1 Tax=Escherichia coli TaxID=562 RepID=UPI0020770846